MSLRATIAFVLFGCGGGITRYGDLLGDPTTPATVSEAPTEPASTPTETTEPGGTTTPPETPCEWTEFPPPTDAPSGDLGLPSWLGVSFVGIVEEGRIHDYTVDGTGYSALLVFDFYAADLGWMCQIVYDASSAAPSVDAWDTPSGDPLWATFDVALGASASTCGTMNGADAHDLVEQTTWGIGLGPLDALEGPLRDALVAQGEDWDGDWAPYTYATYVRSPLFDGSAVAVEVGYATSYDKDCDAVLVDAGAVPYPLPVPTGDAPLADFVSAAPMLVVALGP